MYFFTATINSWQNLLSNDEMKTIITDSLAWLAKENRAIMNGFVIMPNHIHVLWTINNKHQVNEVQDTLLKYTGHEFKKNLVAKNSELLNNYKSTQKDRLYHFWERRARTIEIKSKEIAIQKLNYIHNNPVQEKWKLVSLPEDYRFSSAKFYVGLKTEFDFIAHYNEFI
ncbi:MAG: transposase [Bacteroidota bacterium]